jgi:hypothetical protein
LDKKNLVQIQLGHLNQAGQNASVRLNGSRQLHSLKLKITFNTDRDHAYFATLPTKEDVTTFSYTCESIEGLSIDFDLFPAFGTTAIGRGSLPSTQFHGLIQQSRDGVSTPDCTIALFDSHLRVLGEVTFKLFFIQVCVCVLERG